MAISAVHDALGLGAAKTDVTYVGLEAAVEVLTDFKARLVAAREPGVDKQKIQTELEALKGQLTTIATSANFNGQNWLSTDIADIHDTALATSNVVAAFVRDGDSNVSVRTVDIDLSQTSLFNETGGGILQLDERSPGTIGGLRNTIYNFSSAGGSVALFYDFNGPLTFVDDTTAITFDIVVDADDPATTTSPQPGVTQAVTINRTLVDGVFPGLNGVISTAAQMRAVLQAAVSADVAVGTQSGSPDKMVLHSRGTAARGSSLELTNLNSTLAGSATGGLLASAAPSYGSRAYTYSIFDTEFRVHPEVELSIAIDEDGINHSVAIDRDFVNSALGVTDGRVASATDMVTLMNAAFAANGIAMTASYLGSNFIRYDLDEAVHKEAGTKSTVGVTGATDNVGPLPDFGILDVDITSAANLDNYISGVDSMLMKVTAGAALIGAIQTRIGMQAEFAQTLMDTIGKGVGRLVDADMNETSARLKALQTQQQLGLQALQIANSSSETVLSLFR